MNRHKRDRTFAKPRRRRRHNSHDCPTGKVRFRDHADAVEALHAIANVRHFAVGDEAAGRRECRCYACKTCHGWHLTSRPLAPKPTTTSNRSARR